MVTVRPAANNIGVVPVWTSAFPAIGAARLPRSLLTRRRAVDFCRVATAQCRISYGRIQPSAPQSCGAVS
jgi:hypothetical protein